MNHLIERNMTYQNFIVHSIAEHNLETPAQHKSTLQTFISAKL